ncbi:MAG: hypothetical protein QM658_01495 [Gordonia sp. (in: high G+C Gram-positive bacteria)]
MDYRSALEQQMTLSAESIAQACAGERLSTLMSYCYDEYLELREIAEELADAETSDAEAQHAYYVQEASAWRETAHILREMSRDPMVVVRRNESGVA